MLADSIGSAPIVFQDVSVALPQFLGTRSFSRLAVLVDENTEKHCYPKISASLPPHDVLRIGSGEANKNLDGCKSIWIQLTELNYDRNSLLVNLGGGVIGDMGGFCAATFKRGIGFINIPTTLLAQVDASVGGKLGIDFDNYKNHIGVFQSPQSVIIDTSFLETLNERQLRSGFAEVIKHCLIANASSWAALSQGDFRRLDWSAVVPDSVEIKRVIVSKDPTEKGLRKVLNFGHTIGHAIETYSLSKHEDLLHGEAIAAGMVAEGWLSNQKTGLAKADLDQFSAFLIRTYGKITFNHDELEQIIQLASQDKKNVNSELRFVLLEEIGRAVYDVPVKTNEIRSALEFYLSAG